MMYNLVHCGRNPGDHYHFLGRPPRFDFMPHPAFRSILRPPIGPLLHRRILSACPTDFASRPRYISVKTLPSGCPSCQAPLPTPLPACPKCFYIAQVSPNQTYYQVLDAPYEPNPFLVDLGKLRTQYRNLQWCVHPDIWTARGEASTRCIRIQ